MIIHLNLEELREHLPEGCKGILLSATADGKQLLCEEVSSGEAPLVDSSKNLIKILEVTTHKLLSLTSHVPVLQDSKEGTGDCKGRDNTLSRGYSTSRATVQNIVEIYNEHAKKNKWQQVRVIGEDLKRRITAAIKQFPDTGQWRLIMKGWEADDWFSGRRGDYNRTKILTMLRDKRYEQFYADGLELEDSPKEDSIEDIADKWARLQEQSLAEWHQTHARGGL